MKKRSVTLLGEAEMELLQHVWVLGRATVAEVHAKVLEHRPVAYTTVMTVLKKLADKGYLQYEQEGAAYVYSPARPPEQVRRHLLTDLIKKVFRGSPTALVNTLVSPEMLSDTDREALRALIEKLDSDATPPNTD